MEPSLTNQHILIAFLKNRDLKILLADDNRVNQFLGKRILQNIGVQHVQLASDGSEAFALANSNHYDVILTDVEMPGLSGYELAKAVRAFHGDQPGPIIIALTANASDEDRELARQAGINDYLTKPYSPQDLMDVILRYFSGDELLKMEEIDLSSHHKKDSSLQRVYELFHFNNDDVQHFLRMLSNQLPLLIKEIKDGIRDDQWDRAFQAAHKLKSPVTLLGSHELHATLSTLTEDMRNRRNLPECPATFESILPPLESLLVLINTELEKKI